MQIKNNRQKFFSSILFLIIILLIILMSLDLIPLLKQVVKNSGDESNMVNYVESYGIKGVPILIGLEALQVIVIVFPAAAIQVLAGLCYGVVLGALICIAGYILGNVIVFIAVRQFSSTFFKEKQNKKNSWINANIVKKMNHPEYLAFFLYLIPGVPNGILPYVFATTKITLTRYIISMTIGCVPSILVSTLVGDRISKGDYVSSIIIVMITVVFVLFLIIFRGRIIKALERMNF